MCVTITTIGTTNFLSSLICAVFTFQCSIYKALHQFVNIPSSPIRPLPSYNPLIASFSNDA
ncbi:MAG: hypothetical protein IPN87_11870 [Saprospiraceae bacterium]|nr:hypothetical protein [Candidatus Brachybacter algidus]